MLQTFFSPDLSCDKNILGSLHEGNHLALHDMTRAGFPLSGPHPFNALTAFVNSGTTVKRSPTMP
jgi:hypothetical protein